MDQETFIFRVDRELDGCDRWLGDYDRDGYPRFWDEDMPRPDRLHERGGWVRAASWALANLGAAPFIPGRRITRECGHRYCVRPGPGHLVQYPVGRSPHRVRKTSATGQRPVNVANA